MQMQYHIENTLHLCLLDSLNVNIVNILLTLLHKIYFGKKQLILSNSEFMKTDLYFWVRLVLAI